MEFENLNDDELPQDLRDAKDSVTLIAILFACMVLSLGGLVVYACKVAGVL